MARRPIKVAMKVLIGVVLLGPPIGAILLMLLMQFVPWVANGFPEPVSTFIPGFFAALIAALPLSYVFGGHTAVLAGLALAAYVAWGGRLNLWVCLLAALIYPVLVGAVTLLDARGAENEGLSVLLGYAGVLAGTALAAAAVCYLVLRNTWFMKDATKPPVAAPRDGTL